MAKYLTNNAGTITEVATPTSSAGAGDSGKIPSLDGSGRLDTSFMPAGIGADTKAIVASEALAAGDMVNVWNSTGAKVRKADASVAGKEAHGFVLAAVASSGTATVYFEGPNTQVTGLTPGSQFLSTTPGLATAIAPTGSGNVVQRVGFAVAATEMNFQSQPPIVLA
jgi:hypothetical protein